MISANVAEPEWTAENQNRKRGDTTFKTCGWCKHQGSGSYRHQCMIEGNCNLLKDYDNDVAWNTPCKIVNLGKDDIKAIIDSKKYDIKEHKDGIERLNEEIHTLAKLPNKKTPVLPDNRPHDYYNVNDVVYVFHEKKWNVGKVVAGYRHQDGCVSYVLRDYPKSQAGCGCSVPCILKEWEYNYFKSNPKAFKTWLDLSDRVYNGNKLPITDYYNAISK